MHNRRLLLQKPARIRQILRPSHEEHARPHLATPAHQTSHTGLRTTPPDKLGIHNPYTNSHDQNIGPAENIHIAGRTTLRVTLYTPPHSKTRLTHGVPLHTKALTTTYVLPTSRNPPIGHNNHAYTANFQVSTSFVRKVLRLI